MKNLFYALFFVLFACTSPNTTPDMTLYNANLEIVKKAMACYEKPQDFETFKTLIEQVMDSAQNTPLLLQLQDNQYFFSLRMLQLPKYDLKKHHRK